jgi:hypothetical protein
MARPEGKLKLKGGQELVREPDSLDDDNSARTPSQRLIAPALMELANGNDVDRSRSPDGKQNLYGLTQYWQRSLAAAIFGEPFHCSKDLKTPEQRSAAMSLLAEQVGRKERTLTMVRWSAPQVVVVTELTLRDGKLYAKGKTSSGQPWEMAEERLLPLLASVKAGGPHERPVKTPEEKAEALATVRRHFERGGTQVMLSLGGPENRSGHGVLVTDVVERGGQRYVRFFNPHGTTEELSETDFTERIVSVTFGPLRERQVTPENRPLWNQIYDQPLPSPGA